MTGYTTQEEDIALRMLNSLRLFLNNAIRHISVHGSDYLYEWLVALPLPRGYPEGDLSQVKYPPVVFA